MAVMILVVEAMGLRVWALRSYSTLPVSILTTIAAGDFMAGFVPPKPSKSEARTSKLSVCEASTGRVVVVVPSATPARTEPTTASTTIKRGAAGAAPVLCLSPSYGRV